ncbi:hypothetical protein LZ554_000751 [Drepanopeziza brunnea f. sp. 'monogermtubi']|nr:hypothetical protein LZ554_000751 [Drepanopeziza brunnea f. sp. 'monogermtubi']
MASREPQARPDAGQILIVIHDFTARSSDELSLSKGDRVELIERDDDFGDGWYLGRHLINGNSGLFPEVYTRIAPRGPPSYPPTSTSAAPRSHAISLESPKQDTVPPPAPSISEATSPTAAQPVMALPTAGAEISSQGRNASLAEVLDITNTAPEKVKTTPPPISTKIAAPSKTLLTVVQSHGGQESPVMNETLSVIDEHIIDMNSPHHSVAAAQDRRGTNDSGSEYSSHLEQRMSYINGEETDEEEDQLHTRQEVNAWTPDQVAEYLFTSGVEAKHCEVFRDQDITGDVLLGMDQTSVFLKEFDLGNVGRRLKTWQKIKLLQEEVKGEGSTRRNTTTYSTTYRGSEAGSDEASTHGGNGISPSTMLPRIPSLNERSEPRHSSRMSQRFIRNDSTQSISPRASPVSPITSFRPVGDRRKPSAASVRDMHHIRQSSVNEYITPSLMYSLGGDGALSPKAEDASHKKQPSFDRNWTMGSAAPSTPVRPLSSSGVKIDGSLMNRLSQTFTPATTFDSLDRGYFSGGEAEGRHRNVLRKRGSTVTPTHSRKSSCTDEQRLRSSTLNSRHSRFGSVDSIRESKPPSAAQKYYGITANDRRRPPSENSVNVPLRLVPPPKDFHSPTVTKLEGSPYENTLPLKSPEARQGRGSDWLLPIKPVSSKSFGLRAISDAVTGHEKSRLRSPTEPMTSPIKESPVMSPSRTGSSTPSGGLSLDLDSTDSKSTNAMLAHPKNTKKKSKKETSAYTRGLEKKTPAEQMVGADYSGWMRKRGSNIMASWKPRLFVLKGRRLSYYYSEDDQEEKGLIDISFHRVLPADGDRLTGFSAAITGATTSPTSPAGTQTVTMAEVAAAAEPESTLSKGSGDSIFIFKLVPPRAGAARAVTFTKPTTHYFAVPNVKQGRLWMAALMKATIDRDHSEPIKTTYQQTTISLQKAQAMRHRPPALMNLEDHIDAEAVKAPASDKHGLHIQGIVFDRDPQEGDSGVSGVSKNGSLMPNNLRGTFLDMNGDDDSVDGAPRTA